MDQSEQAVFRRSAAPGTSGSSEGTDLTGGAKAPCCTIGQSASRRAAFTAETVAAFCAATGDINPVHLSDEFAAGTRFGRRIVNGMLTCSLVSSVIGTELPGPGTIYLSQAFTFVAPVFIGDDVTATVTVLGVGEDRPIVRLRTVCRNSAGCIVLDGEATVLVDDGVIGTTRS